MAQALMGSYLPPAATTKFLGIRIQAGFNGDAKGAFDESYAVAIPFFWLVCVLPACVLGLWLWRIRAEKIRRRAGSCAGCSYDLRASKDRCPECGREI